MADRVLSIEIGYLLTKVCEIDRGNKVPKILNSFVIPTPDNMLKDGIIETNNQFLADFGKAMSSNRIKTNKAIFTIASSKIAAREAVIPYVKEKQIQAIVRANLTEYFPVDPSQYVFAHSVVSVIREDVAAIDTSKKEAPADTNAEVGSAAEEDTNDKKSKKGGEDKAAPAKVPLGKPTGYKILCLAAPKQLISGYERLAKSLNLDVVSIDYNGNSIYQAAKEECNKGVQLIVKIDERNSLLMVLEDGAIALNRTIPYGIDDAVQTLQETTSFGKLESYSDALDMARRKTCIMNSFDAASAVEKANQVDADGSEEGDSGKIHEEKALVTNSLRTLAGGIMRVIDYYNSNHSSRTIEKAYITGIGADFSGLSSLLTIEFGMKVKNLVHLAGIDIEKVFKDVTYGEYVTVIGASIAPLKFYPDHEEEGKTAGMQKTGVSPLFIGGLILALGIIAAGVMIAMAYMPYEEAKKENAKYKKTISELQPAYETYEEYLKTRSDIAFLRNVDAAGRNRNEELNEFLTFLEQEMPYTFCVTSITTDYDSMSMEATVGSKEEAAYALKKLKECELFVSAGLSEITWVEDDELGEILYSFKVDLQYAPFDDPNADLLENTEETEGEE